MPNWGNCAHTVLLLDIAVAFVPISEQFSGHALQWGY